MTPRARILALVASLVLLASSARADGVVVMEGTARTYPAGDLAYRETHVFSGNTHRVLYRDPGGTLIAEKSLDYGCDLAAPDWEQRDLRNGRVVGGRWEGATYVLRRDARTSSVSPRLPLVASSGFDNFVRSHWDSLKTADEVNFDFALPADLMTIGMRLQRAEAPEGETGERMWFKAEPSSGLLRLFAGEILLGYDETRTLGFYRGPSNIGDGKGGSLNVEIHYRRVPADAQLAALREPPGTGIRSDAESGCTRHDA